MNPDALSGGALTLAAGLATGHQLRSAEAIDEILARSSRLERD